MWGLLLAGSGCGGDAQPVQMATTGPQGAAPAKSPARRPAAPPQTQQEGYTILLYLFDGPDHAGQALRYKQNTQADTGWSDLYVVHAEGHSTLYRGTYPTAAAARGDLRRVKAYRTKMKIQPYKQALVMPLPGKDIGPPEWDLRNAAGRYTLVVGLFKDDPARNIAAPKQYAVDNVRDLRGQGLEAYFLHEGAQSLVTVGSFPESSYPEVRGADRKFSREIADPKLKDLMKRFPYLAVNGYQEIIRLKSKSAPEQTGVSGSYVLEIPHAEPPR